MDLKFEIIPVPTGEKSSKPEARVRKERENTILTIFAGQKPTGGYSIQVLKAEKTGNACVVSYRVNAPPRDAMVTQALTYPSRAVRIYASCERVELNPPIPLSEGR